MYSVQDAMKLSVALGLVLSAGPAAWAQASSSGDAVSRPFYMGFSDWDFGTTEADKAKTYELIWTHSDLICFQFGDGVPWPEAYEGKPFGKALEDIIQNRLKVLKPGHKVFLEISLLNMNRSGIANYIGEKMDMPMPEHWESYALDDEHMTTAYANYCNRLIEAFKPAYVNYVLEGGNYKLEDAAERERYLRFLDVVYQRVKEAHPEVPLGISATIHDPVESATEAYKEAIGKMLPYVDWLGASFYPFAFFKSDDPGNPNALPKPSIGLIKEIAQGKPVAFTETNWPAEDLVVKSFGLNVHTTPEWQKDFAASLLETADAVDALFVVWWCIADFDRKVASFPQDLQDIASLWRDTGLYDEQLEPRPALSVWDEWLQRPYAR